MGVDTRHGNAIAYCSECDYDISNCKLILKPLSEISDEDAVEVAKIIMPLPFHRHKKGWEVSRDYAITGWPYIRIHNNKNIYSIEIDCTLAEFSMLNMGECVTQETPMKTVQCIDFLRSKGYDVGYSSIKSLIESGIAINVNELK